MRSHPTPLAIYRTYSPYPKNFFIIALMMWFWWLWGLDMQTHYYPQGDLRRGLAYFLLTAVLMISSPYIYHYALRHRFEKQAYYQASVGWATRCPRGLIHTTLFYFFRQPEMKYFTLTYYFSVYD